MGSVISDYLFTTGYVALHIIMTGGIFLLLYSRVLSFIDMFTSVKDTVSPSQVGCLTGSMRARKTSRFPGQISQETVWT